MKIGQLLRAAVSDTLSPASMASVAAWGLAALAAVTGTANKAYAGPTTDPMTQVQLVNSPRIGDPNYAFAPTGVTFNGGFGDISMHGWYGTLYSGGLVPFSGMVSVNSPIISTGLSGLEDGAFFNNRIALMKDNGELNVGNIVNGSWNTAYSVNVLGLAGTAKSLSWVNGVNGNSGYFELVTDRAGYQVFDLGHDGNASANKIFDFGSDAWTVLNLPNTDYTSLIADGGTGFKRVDWTGVPFDSAQGRDWQTSTIAKVIYTADGEVAVQDWGAQYFDPTTIHSSVQTTVPEPATMGLLGLGLCGLIARRKR